MRNGTTSGLISENVFLFEKQQRRTIHSVKLTEINESLPSIKHLSEFTKGVLSHDRKGFDLIIREFSCLQGVFIWL